MSLELSDDELSFAFGLDNWQPFVEQVSPIRSGMGSATRNLHRSMTVL